MLHPIAEIGMKLDEFIECVAKVYRTEARPVDWPSRYCVYTIRRHAGPCLAFGHVAQTSKTVRGMEPIHIAIGLYVFGLDHGYGTQSEFPVMAVFQIRQPSNLSQQLAAQHEIAGGSGDLRNPETSTIAENPLPGPGR